MLKYNCKCWGLNKNNRLKTDNHSTYNHSLMIVGYVCVFSLSFVLRVERELNSLLFHANSHGPTSQSHTAIKQNNNQPQQKSKFKTLKYDLDVYHGNLCACVHASVSTIIWGTHIHTYNC